MTKIDWSKAEQAIPFLENLIEVIKSEKLKDDYIKYWREFFVTNKRTLKADSFHSAIVLKYNIEFEVKLTDYLNTTYGNGTYKFDGAKTTIFGIDYYFERVDEFNKEEFTCPKELGNACYYKIEYLTK